MQPLTGKQQRVYDFIRDYIAERGRSPSYRDIGQALGVTATSVPVYYLRALARKGLVARSHGAGRAIRLLDGAAPAPRPSPPAPGARVALTERQRETLEFIRNFAAERGYPPTIREVGRALGIGSTNGTKGHLFALEAKGWIRCVPHSARAIQILGGGGPPAA